MTATREATCEERIDAYFRATQEDISELLKNYYEGEVEAVEAFLDYPLEISSRKVTKILLSWGGPSDFFKVEHDGGDILAITYHFQDWFDGASRDVEEDSPAWKYCQEVINLQEGLC